MHEYIVYYACVCVCVLMAAAGAVKAEEAATGRSACHALSVFAPSLSAVLIAALMLNGGL